ncbi:MAG: hypothetical protein CUN48_04375 [Candidatus Thermofonsia Clade 3 bacterium]|uniref:Uncharacterized protein n=1 Tax=Candidatus Thermofonsia Clade 3 bacterium TaxID=2364212 RepID=A0A2M8QEN1_9CHLR|nr:MAG: hypothetical protein CUN48_04375 [Candidatus Thermofonsia Clade 3 bacterium]
MRQASNPFASSEACFNIGPKERQKRLIIGIAGITVGVIAFVLMRAAIAPWWANLALLPIFFAGATGVIQWRKKTCVAFARRGVRNLDSGIEAIEDEAERQALNERAARITLESFAFSALATVLAIFLSLIG